MIQSSRFGLNGAMVSRTSVKSRSQPGQTPPSTESQVPGKPCRPRASTTFNTPRRPISRSQLISVGQGPPSTTRLPRRWAQYAAAPVIVQNFIQSGSLRQSQSNRLLGSFHSSTASKAAP